MKHFFSQLGKVIPTFLTAVLLAVFVWVSAVIEKDPTEERPYPQPVTVEIVGQDPGLVIVSSPPRTVNVVLKAPVSTWDVLNNTPGSVRAFIDLSALQEGTHVVPVQVQISAGPVQIVSYTPATAELVLDRLMSRTFDVSVVQRGQVATGYQTGTLQLDQKQVTVTGPATLVERVSEVRAVLDVAQAQQTIQRTLSLVALDSGEQVVSGVVVTPNEVVAHLDVTQRYGYRNVVVKVVVTGQVADGYRLTNISVVPAAITVYSADPQVVNSLPGYVETTALDLSGATDDVDVFQTLNLPPGVSVVGDQMTVLVRVSIASIESSLPLSVPVEVVGLMPGLSARTSPEVITIIVTGPLPKLDGLTADGVRAVVDVSGLSAGSYSLTPRIELAIQDLRVESFLPELVEVVLTVAPTPTRTPRPFP